MGMGGGRVSSGYSLELFVLYGFAGAVRMYGQKGNGLRSWIRMLKQHSSFVEMYIDSLYPRLKVHQDTSCSFSASFTSF